jgi:hypothetical protein
MRRRKGEQVESRGKRKRRGLQKKDRRRRKGEAVENRMRRRGFGKKEKRRRRRLSYILSF